MRCPIPLPALLLLGACTAGPDYRGPPDIATAGDPPAAFVRAGDAAPAAPAVGTWWTALGDPLLDQLEQRALAGSPNMAMAAARLREARSALRLERANRLPGGGTQAAAVYARLPGVDVTTGNGAAGQGGSGNSFDFYTAGFDASWEIDLFGGRRRKIEAAHASLDAAAADAADAQLSLTAEVAQAYVALRERQQHLLHARASADVQRRSLALTIQRAERGTASAIDAERLRGQLETSEAAIPPLVADVQGWMNALATLTGEAPGALDAMLATPAPIPLPPASIAVGDPAALLRRRPDIRAAERRLAAETARIGVVRAARFPRVSLLGFIGLGGTSPSDLADPGKFTALAIPTLQWNLLDIGRNTANIRQAEAARDAAGARYRMTALAALRDAEDALARFGQRRLMLAALARAKASADRAAALTQQRFTAGTATMVDTLDAERRRIDAEQALSNATSDLSNDYIALQKALGLGWKA